MSQSFEPINTVIGIIEGRDAVFLDEATLDYGKQRIIMLGEFNSALCSKSPEPDSYIGYSLTFDGLIGFTMIELDLNNNFGKSSFDRVINSVWIKEMRLKDHSSKVKPNLEHYFLATYDDVFNIVCESFKLEILHSRKA